MDIQRRMLISEIHSLQNENTHLKGKMTDCVPRERYEAKCAENDMNAALLKEASPSFIAFYLRLKISYNVSEQNILKALEAAGCDIPQATLNAYIQDAETTIREFLQDAMAEEIKESRFTHNDETRLMVTCPDKKTGVAGETDARSLLPNRVSIPIDWIPESQIECPTQGKIA